MKTNNCNIYILFVIYLASVTFFILGVTTPILSTRLEVLGFGFKEQGVNLFDSVVLFFDSKEYFLSFIILLFTFLLPAFKYIEIIVSLIIPKYNNKKDNRFSLDKWNMLDVFIVALLLVNFKMGDSIIVMDLQLGTLYLSIAVLTRVLIIEFMDRWCTLNANKEIEDKSTM